MRDDSASPDKTKSPPRTDESGSTTDWKKAHDKLQESRRRLAMLLSNLPGMAYRCRNDRDWSMEFVSEGCRTLTGYAPENILLGTPTFNQLIHEDDRDGVWSEVQEALEEKRPFELSYRIRARDGGEKIVWERGQGVWDDKGVLLALEGFIQDVTEQKRVERAVKESQERYRLLRDEASELLIFSRPDGTILEANAAVEEAYGYSQEELRDLNAQELRAPEKKDSIYSDIDKSISEGGSLYETLHRRKDGTTFPVEISAKGAVIGDEPVVFAVIRDITERKQAEESLRKVSEEQQTIFDCIPAMIWYKDRRNRFIRVNKAVADFMGLEPEQIENHSAEEIFPEFAEKYLRDDLEVIESGLPKLGIIEQARTARGDVRWVRTDKIPYGEAGGEILGVIAFSIDITEAREAEQERDFLFTAIEQAQEGVVITSTSGAILYANRAMAELTGYDRSELLGQNPRVLKSGRHDKRFYESLWNTILAGDVWASQIVNKRRDGSFYTAHLVISPVRDTTGELTAFVCAQRDITREVEMEERLNQAKKLETIGMLTNGVAHEVRNPLFAISTIVAALERKLGPDGDIEEFIVHLKDQSRRLTELMNDLLTLGRPIRKEGFRECLLVNLVQQALELMEDTRPGAGARCELAVSEEGLCVNAAPDRLTQVFVNLIENAFAFSPDEAGVNVRIARDGDFAALEVVDCGPGIPNDILDKLFEPFQTRRKGGTGLGLAIVRQIVTAHGGTVEAYNADPGPGAVFVVRLPLAR